MYTNTISAGIVALGVAVSAAMGWSGYQDLQQPDPRFLKLQSIEYVDGKIRQVIKPVGSESIAGIWAAKISRGDENLCAGGGRSNYTGKPYAGTPSQWTGAKCPELRFGDIASATWEWHDEYGHLRSTSVEFRIE